MSSPHFGWWTHAAGATTFDAVAPFGARAWSGRQGTRTGGPDDDDDDEAALVRKLLPIVTIIIVVATIFGG